MSQINIDYFKIFGGALALVAAINKENAKESFLKLEEINVIL